MPGEIDHHPERRKEQINAARRTLRAGPDHPVTAEDLRHACEILLSLSDAPDDHLLAREVLRALER